MTHTSIEQSKALMHLGLDEKTADLTIISNDIVPYFHTKESKRGSKEYPCWSAEALLDILPKNVYKEEDDDTVDNEDLEYSLDIDKTEDDTYFIGYRYEDIVAYKHYVIQEEGELISVLFKIVEWLLTNKFI